MTDVIKGPMACKFHFMRFSNINMSSPSLPMVPLVARNGVRCKTSTRYPALPLKKQSSDAPIWNFPRMSSYGDRPPLTLLCPPREFGPPIRQWGMRQWGTTAAGCHRREAPPPQETTTARNHHSGSSSAPSFPYCPVWINFSRLNLFVLSYSKFGYDCPKFTAFRHLKLLGLLWLSGSHVYTADGFLRSISPSWGGKSYQRSKWSGNMTF